MWTWKDREIKTYGDLGKAITECQTKEEAAQLLDRYSAEIGVEKAVANVGYIIGYYDAETRKRLFDLFRVDHPIFGRV